MTIAHINVPDPEISRNIWAEKYQYPGEKDWKATCKRVVEAVYEKDVEKTKRHNDETEAYELMCAKLWMPAGRIISGAGTDRNVTLLNCYVGPLMQDSLRTDPDLPGKGIADSQMVTVFTLQQGGGIGNDFSPLRPHGAPVRLGSKLKSSVASGPISFMDAWDRWSATMASAGQRRGAMMGTIRCDHPDIEEFIDAKRTKGRLTQFNVSVLVTDAFMEAVKHDQAWHLWHDSPPINPDRQKLSNPSNVPDGTWVYKTLPARELWEKILRTTYEFSEPGVLFIDRINKLNPLYYCETISCTNPCGEQPLPPYGDCCLGHINLALCVKNPFTSQAVVDYKMIARVARCGVRFLDNVLDVTKFPVPEMEAEAKAKRRIGLGVTGLANLFQQMGLRYGSKTAVDLESDIMSTIAIAAYRQSTVLAQERGTFPAYDAAKHLAGEFINRLPLEVIDGIQRHGLRNGVLLTVAPTGTTSLVYGDVSAGIEPELAHEATRTVIYGDGTREERTGSWGLRALDTALGGAWIGKPPPYMVAVHPSKRLCGTDAPDYMVSVEEQLAVLAAAQRWVDASISKTINCPKGLSFEEFAAVYDRAYELGCKGCTTYVESDLRGSVVRPVEEDNVRNVVSMADGDRNTGAVQQAAAKEEKEAPPVAVGGKRPDDLPAKVHRVKIGDQPSLYVTVAYATFENGRIGPWELFVHAGVEAHGWAIGLTRMLSRALRGGDDPLALAKELEAVHGFDSGWLEGGKGQVGGAVAAVGGVLREHMAFLRGLYGERVDDPDYWGRQQRGLRVGDRLEVTAVAESSMEVVVEESRQVGMLGKPCPSCERVGTLLRAEGCWKCPCGWSNCG